MMRTRNSLFLVFILALLFVSPPLRADIFGTTKTKDYYIKITPENKDADYTDPSSYSAKYEWCQPDGYDDDLKLKTKNCEPIGKSGTYYPLTAFYSVLLNINIEVVFMTKAVPEMLLIGTTIGAFFGATEMGAIFINLTKMAGYNSTWYSFLQVLLAVIMADHWQLPL